MFSNCATLERAYSFIPTVSHCSFDVFDTFLLRRCTRPEGVYEQAGRLIMSRTGRSFPVESFVQHRIQADAKARRKKLEQDKSSEVSISEIYRLFPVRLFSLPADISVLVQAEFDAELLLCRANPAIRKMFEAARSLGVKCGFLSDTYWSGEQISQLLSTCAPGLTWDFLFSSSDAGTSKSEALFQRYLDTCEVDTRAALHIGDNPIADIKSAEGHGIRAIHYAQSDKPLADTFDSEDFVFQTLSSQNQQSPRLDNGLRTRRRLVSRHVDGNDPARSLGQRSIAPILTLFHDFVGAQVRAIGNEAERHAAIAFLGRDGMLPWRLWEKLEPGRGHYLRINRRVSLMASAQDIKPIQDLFVKIPWVDAKAAKAILKFRHSRIDAFFAKIGHKKVSGKEFAKALETMIDDDYVARLGDEMRGEMLRYLRATIADFDACTDLILVDIGYSASIQKLLRKVFDTAGLGIRIHGCYLLTLDDELSDIAVGDTARGFISDLVVTPHTKRALLRNILMIEQIFSSQEGSVLCYRNGEAELESDPRPAGQLALCKNIQDSAIEAASLLHACALDAPAASAMDMDAAAAWCAVIIARLVLMPDRDEVKLLSTFLHDINLGTQTLLPMIEADSLGRAEIADGLRKALVAPQPPMWLAASLTERTPLHGLLYVLFSSGVLPQMALADAKYTTAEVALISGAKAQNVEVPVYKTVTGHIRIRIPTSTRMAVSSLAIPIGRFAQRGRVAGVTVQHGSTATAAMAKDEIGEIAPGKFTWIGVGHNGPMFFDASPDDSYLVVPVDPIRSGTLVTTVELDVNDGTAQSPRQSDSIFPQPAKTVAA